MKTCLALVTSIAMSVAVAGVGVHESGTGPVLAPQETQAADTAVGPGARGAVDRVLNELHLAASAADAARYFALFAPDAVFLGTDPGERWTFEEFWAYARSNFEDGTGWTYEPRDRNVFLNDEESVAWFDEVLYNATYGICRGTGVLTRTGETWAISQYSLSIPVPNDLTRNVVNMIQAQGRENSELTTIILVRHAEHELAADGGDWVLSQTGRRRAKKLQRVLQSVKLQVVFATESTPSQLTSGPVARDNLMKPQFISSTNMEFLADSLSRDYTGRTVLVCGARGSVMDMLKAYGVAGSTRIEDDEHDDLFIITLDSNAQATLKHLHY